MKKFKVLSVIMVLFAAVGLVSCETETLDSDLLMTPTPGGGNSNAPALFRADVDGQPFTANSTIATIGNGLTSIAGIKTDDGKMITLSVQATTTGTYNNVVMIYSADDEDEYGYANFNLSTGQISGTVTISNINTTTRTISGTFSFTGWYGDEAANKPPVAITNGVFTNIPYTSGNPGVTEDSLTATVDGTPIDYVDDIVVSYSGPGQYIGIGGVGSDHIIYVFIKDDLTPGTYNIMPGLGAQVRGRYTNAADEDFGGVGTLTIISKTSTRIKGTYSFATSDPAGVEPIHTVTNAAFDIEYN